MNSILKQIIYEPNIDVRILRKVKHVIKSLVPLFYGFYVTDNKMTPRLRCILFSVISKMYRITDQKRLLVDLIILTINALYSGDLDVDDYSFKLIGKICMMYYGLRNLVEFRTSGSLTLQAKDQLYSYMKSQIRMMYEGFNPNLCLMGVTLAACMSDKYFISMNFGRIFYGLCTGMIMFINKCVNDGIDEMNLKLIYASVLKVIRCYDLVDIVNNEMKSLKFTNHTRFIRDLLNFCFRVLGRCVIRNPWRECLGFFYLQIAGHVFTVCLVKYQDLLNLPMFSYQTTCCIIQLLGFISYPIENGFHDFLIPMINSIFEIIREKQDQYLNYPYSLRRQLYLYRRSIFLYKNRVMELELLSNDFIHMDFEGFDGFDEDFYEDPPIEFLDDLTGRLMMIPVKTKCCDLYIDEAEYVYHSLALVCPNVSHNDYGAERQEDLADEIYFWKLSNFG